MLKWSRFSEYKDSSGNDDLDEIFRASSSFLNISIRSFLATVSGPFFIFQKALSSQFKYWVVISSIFINLYFYYCSSNNQKGFITFLNSFFCFISYSFCYNYKNSHFDVPYFGSTGVLLEPQENPQHWLAIFELAAPFLLATNNNQPIEPNMSLLNKKKPQIVIQKINHSSTSFNKTNIATNFSKK